MEEPQKTKPWTKAGSRNSWARTEPAKLLLSWNVESRLAYRSTHTHYRGVGPTWLLTQPDRSRWRTARTGPTGRFSSNGNFNDRKRYQSGYYSAAALTTVEVVPYFFESHSIFWTSQFWSEWGMYWRKKVTVGRLMLTIGDCIAQLICLLWRLWCPYYFFEK